MKGLVAFQSSTLTFLLAQTLTKDFFYLVFVFVIAFFVSYLICENQIEKIKATKKTEC